MLSVMYLGGVVTTCNPAYTVGTDHLPYSETQQMMYIESYILDYTLEALGMGQMSDAPQDPYTE